MSGEPSGFRCTVCGTEHQFGVYVAAHWAEQLTHTCDCGAQHYVQRGIVRLVKKARAKKVKHDR